MAVFSRYPIVTDRVRTFQHFRWADMPGALLPDDPATAAPAGLVLGRGARGRPAVEQVALGRAGPGRREPPGPGRPHGALPRLAPDAAHLRRRRGPQRHPQPRRDPVLGRLRLRRPRRPLRVRRRRAAAAGWRAGASFVIAGDQNSDPVDGDSVPGAIQQLLDHPRVTDPRPASQRRQGGVRAAGRRQPRARGQPALRHRRLRGHPARQPAGRLRAALHATSRCVGAGVFWPVQANPLSRLTGTFPFPSSDHRSVWVDVQVRGR